MIGTAGLAFLAGILSILSPCVLPLLPIVLGAAVSQHRLGPLALAGGLTLSFTGIGLFVALFGFALGFDTGFFRALAAILLIAIGLLLMVPVAQARLAVAAGPASNWAEQQFGGFSTSGIGGQFAVGLLLGAVWSPCVGPTLGAASLMAARGENLTAVTLTMLAFGIGAGLPLALLGFLSRERLVSLRDRMLATGKRAKIILGALLSAVGVLILTGADKRIEAIVTDLMPDWLVTLTTRL